mmetsp:Transcript_41568/g.71169  ORF Transcript_41568/g.71169 Transcript_41568/m.71169 type:complete len:112 (+) Transcript_41568:110-445(+)
MKLLYLILKGNRMLCCILRGKWTTTHFPLNIPTTMSGVQFIELSGSAASNCMVGNQDCSFCIELGTRITRNFDSKFAVFYLVEVPSSTASISWIIVKDSSLLYESIILQKD